MRNFIFPMFFAVILLMLKAPISSVYGAETPPVSAKTGKALLFLGGGHERDLDVIPELRRNGYQVMADGYKGLTWEKISQFNVIVLCGFPSQEFEGICQLLHRYLKEGGGIFASCGAGQWDRERPGVNVLLKPLDAELPNEQVTDPMHFYRQKDYVGFDFSYTTNVLSSPVSDGIRCVWYPARPFRADGIKMLFPIKTGAEWQVVVKGMPSAYSACSIPNSQDLLKEPATFKQAPPIMAIREFCLGRIAILPIYPSFTFRGGKCKAWEGIVWDKGAIGLQSDTGKLIMNTIGWLASPSITSGGLGGYLEPAIESVVRREGRPVVDWRNKAFPESRRNSYTGIIGVHSSLSDGNGTVEELCASGRKSGYDFLVFTENFERMDEDKWEKLKRKCKEQSADGGIAIPGLDYKDGAGNSYIVWGFFNYPDKTVLSADGKRIIDTYNFWYRIGGMSKLAISRLKDNANIPMQLRHYTCCAVYTYKDGRVIDDALDDFLLLNENHRNIAPMCLRMVYSAAEISQAATFGMQTKVWAQSKAELGKYLVEQDREIFYDRPHRLYLSSGPLIDYWQGMNLISWDENDKGVWKFKFHVSSKNKIAELKIMDGRRSYRRFLPEDAIDFEGEEEGFHIRQQAFAIIVRDSSGGMAISPHLATMAQRQYFCACPDQQNYLSYSWQKDKGGDLTCMTGPVGCQYWGWPPVWNVAVNMDLKEFSPPGWDGIHSKYDYSCVPGVHVEGIKGNAELGTLASTYHLYLASRDVIILDNVVNLKYGKGAANLGDCKPVCPQTPTELIDAKIRQTAFAVRPYAPGFTLIDGEIVAKKDFKLRSDVRPNIDFISIQRPGRLNLAIGGSSRHEIYPSPLNDAALPLAGKLQRGDYVAMFPQITGAPALFSLGSEPVEFNLGINSPCIEIGGFQPDRQVHKGDRWCFSFLAMASPSLANGAGLDFEWARSSMGVGGGRPMYDVRLKRGGVIGSDYVLKLQAKDGGIDGVVTKANLPQDLPIMVYGVSENICAGIYQRATRSLRMIPVKGDVAYVALNINDANQDVFVGNLLRCDDKDIVVTLVEWEAGKRRIVVHNPTSRDVEATISSVPGLDLLQPFSCKVAVGKGSSATLEEPNLRIQPQPATF